MRIEGIGVISKNKALSILTKEGREAVKSGEITIDELGEMYKLELVKKNSKVGNMGDTFRESYKWIPEELKKQHRKKDCPWRLCVMCSQFLKRKTTGRAACWILDLIRIYVLAFA